MKRKLLIVVLSMLLAGCSGSEERPEVTLYTSQNVTSAEITSGDNSSEKQTEEKTETGEETTAEESEETQKETTAEESEETQKETTAEETTETQEETTTQEITELPTESTTEAPHPVAVSATVNGTHYAGDTLNAGDFSISVTMSDGSVLNNPEGWGAAPLSVVNGENYVEVSFEGIKTVASYYGEERPTNPPATVPEITVPTGGDCTIILDPGHGGSDPGAGAFGYHEKDLTLKVAMYCRQYLLDHYDGIDIVMTRSQDNFVDLKSRCNFSSIYDATVLVSFHFNATDAHNAYGAEVLVSMMPGINTYAEYLGNLVLNELSNLGLVNRGNVIRELSPGTDYYAINRYCAEYGKVGIVIEHCFMDNENDLKYINSDQALQSLGEADARAIAAYLGKLPKN